MLIWYETVRKLKFVAIEHRPVGWIVIAIVSCLAEAGTIETD